MRIKLSELLRLLLKGSDSRTDHSISAHRNMKNLNEDECQCRCQCHVGLDRRPNIKRKICFNRCDTHDNSRRLLTKINLTISSIYILHPQSDLPGDLSESKCNLQSSLNNKSSLNTIGSRHQGVIESHWKLSWNWLLETFAIRGAWKYIKNVQWQYDSSNLLFLYYSIGLSRCKSAHLEEMAEYFQQIFDRFSITHKDLSQTRLSYFSDQISNTDKQQNASNELSATSHITHLKQIVILAS